MIYWLRAAEPLAGAAWLLGSARPSCAIRACLAHYVLPAAAREERTLRAFCWLGVPHLLGRYISDPGDQQRENWTSEHHCSALLTRAAEVAPRKGIDRVPCTRIWHTRAEGDAAVAGRLFLRGCPAAPWQQQRGHHSCSSCGSGQENEQVDGSRRAWRPGPIRWQWRGGSGDGCRA